MKGLASIFRCNGCLKKVILPCVGRKAGWKVKNIFAKEFVAAEVVRNV
jgi:hypothetical protein